MKSEDFIKKEPSQAQIAWRNRFKGATNTCRMESRKKENWNLSPYSKCIQKNLSNIAPLDNKVIEGIKEQREKFDDTNLCKSKLKNEDESVLGISE